jgi:hypothetical protein
LQPNETRKYRSPKFAISGNLAFGTPPLNCATKQYPKGINLFEFCLNNDFGKYSQETIDISCVSGVNACIAVNVSDNNWWSDTITTAFSNDTLYANTNRIGVFPYGCDVCTGSSKPPVCPGHLPYEKGSKDARCQVQRPAVDKGGVVNVFFKGFTGK